MITGAGRAFSTGVDLRSLAAGEMTLPRFVAWEDAMTAIERMPIPFIAAINGHCLGGGLQLALVCDYRLAAADAVIGLPAVKECLIPSMALYRLPRLIGAARAREMILTGEPISAERAADFGLVNQTVPASEFPRALDAVHRALPRAARDRGGGEQGAPGARLRSALRRLSPRDGGGFRLCLDSAEHQAAMDEIRRRRKGPAR